MDCGDQIISDTGTMSVMPSKRYRFALVSVVNDHKKMAMNKDLSGGVGTADDYGGSVATNIVRFIKSKSISLPVISFAYLQSVLKQLGHLVQYFEGEIPAHQSAEFDVVLIYGTIVDYKYENIVAQKIAQQYPKAKVGFFGPFPGVKPELFSNFNFILKGEAEAYFMEQFKELSELEGIVTVHKLTDLDSLPSPDLSGLPVENYGYAPALNARPFATLKSSMGCPYSCSYYCTYGEFQGPKIRQRSAGKVVDDIVNYQKGWGIKGILFRDPVFGLKNQFITEFCDELERRKVKIKWAMETRLDVLSEELIIRMHQLGLRNINIGIETNDPEIAKASKRVLVKEDLQLKMIRFCEKVGVKISAFYIFGLEGDTEKSVNSLVDYAMKLNTHLTRFAISTPYPGTGFYDQVKREGRLLTDDLEKYSQFNLVYKHDGLDPKQVRKLLQRAVRRYYFRPRYMLMNFKWRVRELIELGVEFSIKLYKFPSSRYKKRSSQRSIL